jgi:hypothetical protein
MTSGQGKSNSNQRNRAVNMLNNYIRNQNKITSYLGGFFLSTHLLNKCQLKSKESLKEIFLKEVPISKTSLKRH